jgi:hypothetical protein
MICFFVKFVSVRNVNDVSDFDCLQVMCFYFVFTVFVTVGFGDITAGNTSERVLLPLPPLLLQLPLLLLSFLFSVRYETLKY